MSELRTPPHHDNAERALLGIMFRDNRLIARIRTHVRVGDFYQPSHRHIYRTACDIHDQGDEVDGLSVSLALHDAGLLIAVGKDKVSELSSNVVTASNVDRYIGIVTDMARMRRFITSMQYAVDEAYDAGSDAKGFFGDVSQKIAELAPGGRVDDYVTFGAALDECVDEYRAREESEGESGMLSGCTALDELVGGWHTGRAVMLAGLSKMGKTKLTAQVVMGLALNNDVAVDWYSVEMPAKDMARRALSYAGGIQESMLTNPYRYNARDNMTHQRNIVLAQNRLSTLRDRIRYYNRAKPDLDWILTNTQMRKAQLAGEMPLIVVVDYLQRVSAGHRGAGAEYANVTEASQMLTGAANEMDFLGLYVSHFNRGAAQREGMPRASDARGSGAIEQDCNHFIIVHRPHWEIPTVDAESARKKSFTVCQQSLNRHGDTGMAVLEADLGRNIFREWQGDYPEIKGGRS